ncbi:hypothetical protein QQF64_035947 [Cirrhinus molitorella]|uniref:Mutator-like transposase domain-containing protein n=1 Tax=Cirrhinus molitorella TaxID=172907 RepID=A0ABR3NHC4_9TELE
MGYAALKKISKVLGIPSLHLKTYQRHNRKVTVAEIERGLGSLHRAREQIRQAYAEVDTDVARLLMEDEDAVINISVSFDGTWHKRGFTSNYGIGVCIDVLTGLVIDFEVLSSYCHACALKNNAKREGKITDREFESWREAHTDCAKNFAGSSKAMEQEAAKRMWARSVSCPQVRYTEMLSDGDSAAFKEVVALNPYPGHEIVKLECINHAHKRMGTALRQLSKLGKLGGKGLGKLTPPKCKALQNFYRGAIINNQGSVDKMKAEIWAGLLHNMSSDDNPLHTRCSPSWCWYRRAEENGETPSPTSITLKTFCHVKWERSLSLCTTECPVTVCYSACSMEGLKMQMSASTLSYGPDVQKQYLWGKAELRLQPVWLLPLLMMVPFAMLAVMDKLWLQCTVITVNACSYTDMVRLSKANIFSPPV